MAGKKSSPHKLASSDTPGLLITLTQLRGDNYDEWARAIRTSLRAKKKLGFVDGSIVEPQKTDEDYDDWISINSMLISWFMNTIESGLRSTVTYRDTTRELWVDIQERFDVSNGPRIQQLKAELYACKQGKGMSVADYYAKIKKIWEALAECDLVPKCDCGGCTCNVAAKIEKRVEDEKIHQFLMGLDDSLYESVRSTILAADPMGNLNNIYSTLIREERMRTATKFKDDRPNVMSFAVQTNVSRGRGESRLESKESIRF